MIYRRDFTSTIARYNHYTNRHVHNKSYYIRVFPSLAQMVNASLNMGETGDCQWLSGKTDSVMSNCKQTNKHMEDFYRHLGLDDFVVDASQPVQTLLYKTTTAIGTFRFQLIDSDSGDASDYGINKQLAGSNRMKRNKSNSCTTLNIPPKLNPCKAKTQTWNTDIFRVTTSPAGLLIFTQSSGVPAEVQPNLYRRQRYAAKQLNFSFHRKAK